MIAAHPIVPRTLRQEGRVANWTRQAKTTVLQTRRLADWVLAPQGFPAPKLGNAEDFPHLMYARSIPIGRADAAAHPLLEAGKRANLELAAPKFHGLVLDPETPLSYWRTLGRATESAGFRHGMELRGGCIIPSIGGGLCLIANALFEMAAHLGWRILERHGHTLEAVPPTPGEMWGLDATVFWPYVDLRIAPTESEVWIGLEVGGSGLLLSVRAKEPRRTRCELSVPYEETIETRDGNFRENCIRRSTFDVASGALLRQEVIATNRRRILTLPEQKRNCLTCGETGCHSRVSLGRAR
jgi:vancomycin resistance protein VanW